MASQQESRRSQKMRTSVNLPTLFRRRTIHASSGTCPAGDGRIPLATSQECQMSRSPVSANRPQDAAGLPSHGAPRAASGAALVPAHRSLAELDQWRRQLNRYCEGITRQLDGIRGNLTDAAVNASDSHSVADDACRLTLLLRRRSSCNVPNRDALSVFTVTVGEC